MNDDFSVSLSFSELCNKDSLIEIIGILAKFTNKPLKNLEEYNLERRPYGGLLTRPLDFMKQEIFNSIHS